MNSRLFTALFLLASLTASVPSHGNPVGQEKELIAAAVAHAETMVETYPPDKYFILNLGMGNTFLSAALRNIFPDVAMQNAYFFDSPLTMLNVEKETLVRALALSLPPPEVLRGRKIVISRPLYFGDTMNRVVDLLPEISRAYGANLDIEFSFVAADELSDDFEPFESLRQLRREASQPGSRIRVFRDDELIQRYLTARYEIGVNYFELYHPYEAITAREYVAEGGKGILQANLLHRELVGVVGRQHPNLPARPVAKAAARRLNRFLTISAFIDFCKR